MLCACVYVCASADTHVCECVFRLCENVRGVSVYSTRHVTEASHCESQIRWCRGSFTSFPGGICTACVSHVVGMSENSQDDAGFVASVKSRYAKYLFKMQIKLKLRPHIYKH